MFGSYRLNGEQQLSKWSKDYGVKSDAFHIMENLEKGQEPLISYP